MSKGTRLKTIIDGNTYCLFDEIEIDNFSSRMLSAEYWLEKNAITGSAQGRGTTWFVKYQNQKQSNEKHWVLRHYFRGGLIGKLIKDSYIFTSIENTRAAREFLLLAKMQKLALPTPKPIAYRTIRKGIFYKADLLSSRIKNAKDLVDILSEKALTDSQWQNIGRTIKRFHDNNIYHHDLNAHNILIDKQENVFLIDFDRGEIRTSHQNIWQKSNMDRLQRSFLKELERVPNFKWKKENWKLLLEGYLSN